MKKDNQLKQIKPSTPPKYKRELRQTIIDNVKDIKNSTVLYELYIITDIYCRWWLNEESYKSVTNEEWYKMHLVGKILRYKELKDLEEIRNYIYGREEAGNIRRC